jgi:hypothetical protein
VEEDARYHDEHQQQSTSYNKSLRLAAHPARGAQLSTWRELWLPGRWFSGSARRNSGERGTRSTVGKCAQGFLALATCVIIRNRRRRVRF